MFSFSSLVTDEALEATRRDFEDETVLVMEDLSEDVPDSDQRFLRKLNEIKQSKEGRIERASKLQKYLGGLAGFIEYLLNSIKIFSVTILISLIWALLQLTKKFLRKNIELMERAKFEKRPGSDKLRSYFRTRWNISLGKIDFLAPVILMAIFFRINRNFYRGSFQVYQDGIREYMESGSKYSAFKEVLQSV